MSGVIGCEHQKPTRLNLAPSPSCLNLDPRAPLA
jgi:hypothetical protein